MSRRTHDKKHNANKEIVKRTCPKCYHKNAWKNMNQRGFRCSRCSTRFD